ncbi:CDP-diacylglycerol--glycerol-3-phosphate 3-phosphatidyltransferase [Paucidesulfovibrio gracilis DSM 16080]|uniref:CDP-diacylglycerol--glycerol-3-phosphate 3-phosphatidyltransferase n=1 Tax=Paucidesulfovibrio gracilis DSM 16080 TaxID=1121449 RepID=A0A1T4WRZ3_9BACT|nr:CDP-diacylglycerol--glycerol-3-phosphate 3-phosphatidyltransferase [Paucidesulfovibrio gracilis]SKA80130.1 CDP-diacylglycerol--glycerol-3-phosphate 3-phosphatidyltransferase [Paucidesulfovibrio gracilis DSM 16080]
MFNLPNSLTLARVGAVPLIILLMYFPGAFTAWLATLVFVAACITDMLDGMLARRRSQVTSMGKFLDPLADKLLICSVLVMLVHQGRAPAWVVILILGRELAVTGMRAIAAERGLVVAADNFGKLKTVLQIVALVPLIFGRELLGLDLPSIGTFLLYAALVLTVFSGGNYLYNFYVNLLHDQGKEDESV